MAVEASARVPVSSDAVQTSTAGRKRRFQLSGLLTHFVLIIGSVFALLPFVWMVATSLKTSDQATNFPKNADLGATLRMFVPTNPQWSNYKDAWQSADFGRYFFNSILVASLCTVGVLITSVLAAYAFAKLDFRGSGLIFGLVLATMMIPHEAAYIPNFVIVRNLQWIDTYAALVIPWIASPFNIFLLRQFFRALPEEIYEAAALDGCSRLRFIWQFAVPLSKPALITAGLFSFIGSWNSLLWPLIVTSQDSMRTIQVGLSNFLNSEQNEFHLLMAAATFTILPIIVIYFFAQRQFVEGIAKTGVKLSAPTLH